MIDIDTLLTSHVNEHVYRVIPTRYPQVSLFERVSGPEHWDVLDIDQSPVAFPLSTGKNHRRGMA